MAGTYEQAAIGEPVSTGDPKILTQLSGMNAELNSENDLEGKGIAKGFLGRWYAPVVTATEQTRESTSYGTLTTPDEVKNVVLPANGIIVIGYIAKWKSPVAADGQAAIFLNSVQLKNTTIAAGIETGTSGGPEFGVVSTTAFGINAASGATALPTTGAPLSPGAAIGGPVHVFAEAGTYNVSIQFKTASAKSVSVKERKLWVGVIGGV